MPHGYSQRPGNTYAVLQQIDKSIELLDETHILSIQRFGVVHPNTRLIRRNLVSARIYGLTLRREGLGETLSPQKSSFRRLRPVSYITHLTQ